jgi:hypothetical protein
MVEFVIGTDVDELIEIEAVIADGVLPPALKAAAFARTLVMRKTRSAPWVTGGRTGTP